MGEVGLGGRRQVAKLPTSLHLDPPPSTPMNSPFQHGSLPIFCLFLHCIYYFPSISTREPWLSEGYHSIYGHISIIATWADHMLESRPVEPSGTCQIVLEPSGRSWKLLETPGNSWNLLLIHWGSFPLVGDACSASSFSWGSTPLVCNRSIRGPDTVSEVLLDMYIR